MPRKIIVTADDYGVVPSINEGVESAVAAQKVNSVGAFANYTGQERYNLKSAKENIQHLIGIGEVAQSDQYELEVGCHLTLTSGKPLSDVFDGSDVGHYLLDHGNFRSYTNMLRAGTISERQELCRLLKTELQAQFDHIQEATGNNTAFISCHHNALHLFEEYYKVYTDLAAANNVPMRSPDIAPPKKENLYFQILRIRHNEDLNYSDRYHIKDFQKRIKAVFKDLDIRSTDYMNSSHYGPIPGTAIRPIRKIKKKKHKRLRELLGDLSTMPEDTVAELMLHLAHHQNKNKLPEGLDYKGINPGYFRGRRAEHLSILKYDLSAIPFARWSDL